jgi:hypothetical protein
MAGALPVAGSAMSRGFTRIFMVGSPAGADGEASPAVGEAGADSTGGGGADGTGGGGAPVAGAESGRLRGFNRSGGGSDSLLIAWEAGEVSADGRT